MTANPDVLIIGGGIIGASCANELAQRGLRVTIIDKGEIGHGCSYGNAGWITPCFAMPLPMPGMLLKSLKWLLNPDSPLYIQPRMSWALLSWLLRFVRSMNATQMQQSVAALTEISKFSLDAYRMLDAEQPGAFGFQHRGLLMVAQTSEGLEAARLEMNLVAQHGIPGQDLDAAGLRKLEPAIIGANVCGGVYFPNEAYVEPLATVAMFIRRAELAGAEVCPRTEVFELSRKGQRIVGVRTTKGWIKADQIVLATGAWSSQFAGSLGIRIPMLSGKGYAVTVDRFTPSPQIPCMLIEKKIAVTPRENSLRLAGTLELVGIDESITTRRVITMIANAADYLNLPPEPREIEVWRGLRPCTPDGVPIIGRPKALTNVVVAAGHQMLGLQTAPATGRLVRDFVLEETPTFDPYPFRADRF